MIDQVIAVALFTLAGVGLDELVRWLWRQRRGRRENTPAAAKKAIAEITAALAAHNDAVRLRDGRERPPPFPPNRRHRGH